MTATRRGTLLGGLALAGAPAAGRADAAEPSLDTVARGRGLRFGSAINAGARGGVADPAYAALVARECGIVTPENELKWAAVEPRRGEARWEGADRIVGWARSHGVRVRGHNLLWLNAKWLPPWVDTLDLGPRPALAAERLLTAHVAAVCARYGDGLAAWDVVNEAVDPETGRVRDTVLTRALGDRVVDVAFHAARAALPTTPLVYNDYMGWERGGARHRDGVLALLHRLKRDGASVDALGLQSHLDGGAHARGAVEPEGWRAFLADAAGLGLKLSVTELDVSDRGLPADVGQRDAAVAACARAYLDLTLARPEVTEVVCWGLTDRISWLQTEQPRADGRPQRPCPYDAEGRPKPLRAAIAQALAAAPPALGGTRRCVPPCESGASEERRVMSGGGRWATMPSAVVAASCAAVLAGCATTPAGAPAKPPAAVARPAAPAAPRFVATPGLSPAERLRNLLDLLNSGARDQARAEAQELVRQEPDNARAKSLLNQIDADPQALLGSTNFPYKLKAGETLQTVAERYLGDRTLFYALARYNGLAAPNLAQPGMTILVPGVRRSPAPAPVAPRRRAPAASEPPRPPAQPAAPARNPAQARALRGQALVQMNRGAINRAVDLLRQAAQLDPDSAPIKADLARALRIQRATHGG